MEWILYRIPHLLLEKEECRKTCFLTSGHMQGQCNRACCLGPIQFGQFLQPGLNCSIFYLHMYKDGQVAKLGVDTCKAFQVKDYNLLWSGEVGHSPASHYSNLTAILGDSKTNIHTTLRLAKSIRC